MRQPAANLHGFSIDLVEHHEWKRRFQPRRNRRFQRVPVRDFPT
jgi:hypothetical protein